MISRTKSLLASFIALAMMIAATAILLPSKSTSTDRQIVSVQKVEQPPVAVTTAMTVELQRIYRVAGTLSRAQYDSGFENKLAFRTVAFPLRA